MNKKILISDAIRQACPHFVGAAVEATVVNNPYAAGLWEEINRLDRELQARYTTEDIKLIPGVAATRQAYKNLGKDPSRYRPSGEQLMRRILQGKGLYQIDTLVDLVNLASMKWGYSIGGFDADKISGDTLTLGVGEKDEPYEGIGRGLLNIEHMPVYRDAVGGIGTPTSDNERTKMSLQTTRIIAIVNGYDGNTETVSDTARMIVDLVTRYCDAKDVSWVLF